MRRTLLVASAALAACAVPAAAAPGDFRVACLTSAGDVARARPGTCVILGLGFGDAGYFALRNLRWTGWGTPSAAARGVHLSVGFETEVVTRIPARVTLGRLRRGCDGRRWYTAVRVSLNGGRPLGMRLPSCPGPRD